MVAHAVGTDLFVRGEPLPAAACWQADPRDQRLEPRPRPGQLPPAPPAGPPFLVARTAPPAQSVYADRLSFPQVLGVGAGAARQQLPHGPRRSLRLERGMSWHAPAELTAAFTDGHYIAPLAALPATPPVPPAGVSAYCGVYRHASGSRPLWLLHSGTPVYANAHGGFVVAAPSLSTSTACGSKGRTCWSCTTCSTMTATRRTSRSRSSRWCCCRRRARAASRTVKPSRSSGGARRGAAAPTAHAHHRRPAPEARCWGDVRAVPRAVRHDPCLP